MSLLLRLERTVLEIITSDIPLQEKKEKLRSTSGQRAHGCWTQAFLYPEVVVKMNLHEVDREIREGCHGDVISDAKFIQSIRSNWLFRKFFPETEIVNDVVVAERCDINTQRYMNHADHINRIGAAFGLYDIGPSNVGWRKNTPVFIDVGGREPKKFSEIVMKLPIKLSIKGESHA